MKSIGTSLEPMEAAFLRRLLEGGDSRLQLEEEGFPRAVIAEGLNRLLRDRCVQVEGDSIRLSKVGIALLAGKLREPQ
jgi:hypothetical protein